MHFYALRISCESCSRAFVVGGSPQSDLTSWRGVLVECNHCGASVLATTGEVVDVGPRRPGRATRRLPWQRPHALGPDPGVIEM